MGEKGVKFTEDANAADESYHSGIEKRGGLLLGRRWLGNETNFNAIATARQIGDVKIESSQGTHLEDNIGGNPRPKVIKLSRVQLDKYIKSAKERGEKAYLVLASDEIWNVTSPKGVASFLTQIKDKSLDQKAELITLKAVASGSGDNCSAIVIDLEKFMAKEKSKES